MRLALLSRDLAKTHAFDFGESTDKKIMKIHVLVNPSLKGLKRREVLQKKFKRTPKLNKIHLIMKERSHNAELVIQSFTKQMEVQMNLISAYMNLLQDQYSSVIPQNHN